MGETCEHCACVVSAWLNWKKDGKVYCSEDCAWRGTPREDRDDK